MHRETAAGVLGKGFGSGDFNRLWVSSFGSQIEMLAHLNMVKQENARNLYGYFDKFQSRLGTNVSKPLRDRYSYRLYLEDMLHKNLIQIDKSDPKRAKVVITPLAENFLRYIEEKHKLDLRPL